VRICHLSWEFPPVVYGGLGRHVHAVATEQARAGHDVVVLSHVGLDVDDAHAEPKDEIVEGVRVIRVVRDAPFVPFEAGTLLGWVGGLASGMTRSAARLGRQWTPEVVHGHDWLTAHAAALTSEAFGVPWVHTIHATEAGRHQGWLPGELSRSIHSIEGWSAQQADRVLVCSRHMKWEVERLFGAGDHQVVPNGIDSAAGIADTDLRSVTADESGSPLLVHTGRLEWEKGAHTLIAALPRIRRKYPNVRCVIAGKGSQEEALRELARRKRVASRVDFVGWLPELELRALVSAADVAVVPSIYEPFGIVALEAAALRTPVVASKAGGLAEFLDDEAHGWSFEAGDVAGLADAVCLSLTHADEAAKRAARARAHVVAHHSWASIAAQIVDVYEVEIARDAFGPRRRAHSEPSGHVASPEGNLLFDAR